ncbi:MAG: hypothetical protein K2Q26_02790 [Bdellovibrionales bacterium]|nr:hypothetical protein [Bdellovibrionales bacterium]
MSATRTLNINENEIISLIPDLSGQTLTGVSGEFSGTSFFIEQDEVKWKTTVSKMPNKKVQSQDIELHSSIGAILLRKAFWTSYSGGDLQGTCTHIHLKKNGTPSNQGNVRYRSVIYLDKKPDLLFPHFIKDTSGYEGSLWLPLRYNDLEFNLYCLPENHILVFDAPNGVSFDQFQKFSGTTRVLFSYLLGISLEQHSCEMALSSDGKTVHEAWWYSGRNRIANSYTPIPSSWGHWATAKRAISIPPLMRHLDDEVLSLVWTNLLNWQDLLVPIEYLLTFHPAPVEMRGALLSVALESLTSCISEKYKSSSPKPLEDKNSWKQLRDALNNLLEQQGTALTGDSKEIFKKRINELNSPTNKAKLTLPFKQFDIEISDEDADAIATRNDFLHRGGLLEESVRKQGDSWREVYYTEMRIYTLTNRLLLAVLEYEGPVINWGETLLGGGQTKYLYQNRKSPPK